MLTRLGTDIAMLVHVSMAQTLGGTGPCEGDACGQLRFQKLPVTDLVGPRQDTAGRGADSCAIVIEADTGNQPLDMLLGKTGIGAGGAGFYTTETRVDAAADRIGMARLLRMRTEHGSDCNSGHGYLPCERACRITFVAALCSGEEKVPDYLELHKSSHGFVAF